MKKITILDTSNASTNIGDFIIMDSVNKELKKMFKSSMFFYSTTHDKVANHTYNLHKISDYSFVGGTNLLSSNMNDYNQWKINLFDGLFMKNIILMGVGWWQYQKKPNIYTKYLLKSVLSNHALHSVRDAYTQDKLKSMGINNVINTGCPTMWQLNEQHCSSIQVGQSKNVVFTLTDYNKDAVLDQQLINILKTNYNSIYFWPQGSGDLDYFKNLKNIADIVVLGGNLDCYDEILNNKDLNVEFIGTRLHAGIRALQKKCRTIILSVDNRAEEKAKDFNLQVLSRNNIDKLEKLLLSDFKTEIKINEFNINIWKEQFI